MAIRVKQKPKTGNGCLLTCTMFVSENNNLIQKIRKMNWLKDTTNSSEGERIER
jgi:hypothetical protein